MLTLRRADAGDSDLLWSWRNDPVTRAASSSPAPVPGEVHHRWFAAAVDDPERAILIGLDSAGDRVGMVRFDFDEPLAATVSINVAPESRGHGVGHALLHAALVWLGDHSTGKTVTAVVRSDNKASSRIFEHEGFTPTSQDGEFVTMVRPLGRTDPRRGSPS